MIQVGGHDAFGIDYHIPLKYGVDQCIGDTLGPGGIFRGLRHIPVLKDIATDMAEVAKPHAIMLQYANPMAANCLALGACRMCRLSGCVTACRRRSISSRDIAASPTKTKSPTPAAESITWIGSCAWNTRAAISIPSFAKSSSAEYYKNEKVRGEVFRHFGYFMTESTGHLSEYVPWFRKNAVAMKLYCDEPAFGGESGAYYKWGKTMAEKYATTDPLQFESTAIEQRSVEYCSWIMEAVATGKPFRLMGNVRNDGYITNLPNGCCVEVPTFADDTGLRPTVVGALPPRCAAACMTNVNVQTLDCGCGADR